MFTPAEHFFTPEQLAAAERLAGDLALAPYPMPNPLAPKSAPKPAAAPAPEPKGRIVGNWWVRTSL